MKILQEPTSVTTTAMGLLLPAIFTRQKIWILAENNSDSQTKISEDWQIAKESQSSRQVKMNKDESEEEAMRISVKSADYEIIYELNNS